MSTHFGSNQPIYPVNQPEPISAKRIYATAAVGALAVATFGVAAPVVVWCAKHKFLTGLIVKVVL